MKLMTIFIISLAIILLWCVAYILYKPVYNNVTEKYEINKSEIQLANTCIFIIIGLSMFIGLLL